MEATVYIDREGLRVAAAGGLIGLFGPSGTILLSPGEAQEARDAIVHWLDHLEDEADLRALAEARANDDGTRTPLRDFKEENDNE